MKCLNPYVVHNLFHRFAVPCRKCEVCRVINKQQWVDRLIMESYFYEQNEIAFVTLTYNDYYLPLSEENKPTLKYSDVQLFLKRLRKRLKYKIRYFCSGEYGSRTLRPHYHLIIFGLQEEDWFLINDTWNKGIIDIKICNQGAFRYVTSYVNKKFDKKVSREGVFPEFLRFSQGLGKGFVELLSHEIVKDRVIKYNDLFGLPDIANEIIFCGKPLKIPKYVKNKLRDLLFSQEYIGELKQKIIEGMSEAHENVLFKYLGFLPPVDREFLYLSEAYLNENMAILERIRKKQLIYEEKRKNL